jgi:hypothetical protein
MSQRADVREAASRRYWREAEARVVVEGWRRAGEPLGRFAKRHGVDPRRLSRWASRLEASAAARVRFHPVRLTARAPASRADGAIEIDLGSGRCVRVPGGFEAEDLRRVLAVLKEEGPC